MLPTPCLHAGSPLPADLEGAPAVVEDGALTIEYEVAGQPVSVEMAIQVQFGYDHMRVERSSFCGVETGRAELVDVQATDPAVEAASVAYWEQFSQTDYVGGTRFALIAG